MTLVDLPMIVNIPIKTVLLKLNIKKVKMMYAGFMLVIVYKKKKT